jgi:class 3 adenylate cyclase/tetratricopeptide (TPR) repeat protein
MAGERRIVTMLFCDVKGSTAAAEQLDPEEWAEIMNSAFEYLIKPVYHYEGTLARLMGDAVLAFFGAPISHEDDPERGVLAALEIVSRIQPFCDQVRQRWGLEFNVRVGLNTGLVVVGEVGSDLRLEYTAMGDAINLAARMEQTATPGTVQISEETYRRVSPRFDVEPLGPIQVKGKAEPVSAYRVLQRAAQPGPTRGLQGMQAPLIGRVEELDGLQSALAQLGQGVGGVVCLIGEAGLGKSRLIEEARSRWPAREGDSWLQTRGLSYETHHPYGIFQQLLRALAGASEGDHPEQVSRALQARLELLPPQDRQAAASAFDVLLGAGAQPSALQGETLKRELFHVTYELWRRRAAAGAGVLVFDDLHWADAASIELLSHLLQLTDVGPILFLFAFRGDRTAPSWKIKQLAETEYPHRYQEIVLRPLSDESSQSLVDHLLTLSELPQAVHALILQRAEGNPFFVEEVVRSLIDSDALVWDEARGIWGLGAKVEEIQIPDNVQALLQARIDRLEEQARHTLQLASVIGRSFYYRVLRAIHEAGAELDRDLGTLQRVELIREATREPELEYVFRHALTQEAAYRSILRKERTAFHLRVAEALEQLFGDRTEELAPLLASHFAEAGDPRALRYLIQAGDAAFRMYAIPESVAQYSRALESLDQATAEPETILHLYERLGRSHELVADWDQALRTYDQLEQLGQQRSDPHIVLASLMDRATILSTPNPAMDPARGAELLPRARALAQELGDQAAEAKLLWLLMTNGFLSRDEPQQRLEYGEASLALARKLNLREQMAFTLLDLWFAYPCVDRWDKMRQALEESRILWTELGNLPMLADTIARSSMAYMAAGEYPRAIAASEEAFRIAEQGKNAEGQALSHNHIGDAHFDLGHIDTALSVMQRSISLAEPLGSIAVLTGTRGDLGWVYGYLGEFERGMELAGQGLQYAAATFSPIRVWPGFAMMRLLLQQGDLVAAEALQKELGDFREVKVQIGFLVPGWVGMGLVSIELAIAQGDFARAIMDADDLLDLMRKGEIRIWRSDALMLKALALRAVDAGEQARQALEEARQEAESLSSRRILWRILSTQSAWEREAGRGEQANRLDLRAAETIAYIAEHISQPDLRQSFLTQPAVAAVLARAPGSRHSAVKA